PRQRSPREGEPDRHPDGDAGGGGAGQAGRLGHRHLASIRGDGGHLHRRPRGGRECRPDQDRLALPRRAPGQVHPAPAPRGGAGAIRGMAGPRRLRKPRAMSLRSRRVLRTVVLAVLAISLGAYGGQSLTRVWALKKEVESLEREVGALRADTARLTAGVGRLRTDPAEIEQIAREKLGLVKPGERVYKLPPASGTR